MLLELFSGGSRLEVRAGWRWMMVMILELELVVPVCLNLSLAGGSSPPYIGDGLGFWVTRKLQGCPYDTNYSLVRLELVVMILYREHPTRSTVHWRQLRRAGPPVRSCRLVGPASVQPDVDVRVDTFGLIQPAWSSRQALAGVPLTA